MQVGDAGVELRWQISENEKGMKLVPRFASVSRMEWIDHMGKGPNYRCNAMWIHHLPHQLGLITADGWFIIIYHSSLFM